MSWKILLALLFLYFLILVLGGLAFHYLESVDENQDIKMKEKQTKDKIKELLSIYQCPDEQELEHIIREVLQLYDRDNFTLSNSTASSGINWDIPNSMFFAATLATTIGYGNMAPKTQMGRAFCVFYAFVSIPVCLVMLGGVGHTITQLFNRLDKKMDKCKNPKAEKITKSLRSLTTLIIGMGLFMFLPAGAFMYMEDWSYPDSLYYVFITLTTVGLGDLVTGTGADKYDQEGTKTSYQLSVALWIIFGLAWLSTVIAMAQDFFKSLVEKVDTVVGEQMKPRFLNMVDKVDDKVISQLRLSTLQERFRRPSVYDSSEQPESSDFRENDEKAPPRPTPRIVLTESSPDANNPPTILLNVGELREEKTESKKRVKNKDKMKDKTNKRSSKVEQYSINGDIH